MNSAWEVAAQAAVAHGCADGGSGFIAPAGSGSRRLRQIQWYCRKADRNQSKFNRCNLSHIVFPPSHVGLGLGDVCFIPKSSARADPALLRTRRIFQCYRRGHRCSLVRDRMEGTSLGTRTIAKFRWSPPTGTGDVFTCQFRPRVCPIFSKAAAMPAVRFSKGRRRHLPSRQRARQTPW